MKGTAKNTHFKPKVLTWIPHKSPAIPLAQHCNAKWPECRKWRCRHGNFIQTHTHQRHPRGLTPTYGTYSHSKEGESTADLKPPTHSIHNIELKISSLFPVPRDGKSSMYKGCSGLICLGCWGTLPSSSHFAMEKQLLGQMRAPKPSGSFISNFWLAI